MASFNKVMLMGNLTRNPELKYTPSGHPVSTLRLAVDRQFKSSSGERETDFIDVVSTGCEPGNFSKAKRGILVTT